jgi:hypothetical protein
MKVRRRNVARRNEKPQHAKGVSRLFRTHYNMGFLPKRPYHTVVVDSQGFGFNIGHSISPSMSGSPPTPNIVRADPLFQQIVFIRLFDRTDGLEISDQ